MNLYDPVEIVVTQDTTYILISHINDSYRRIYTDGRDWPAEGKYEPSYAGYSIGKWLDTTGSGHYDVLEVETRHFRGPRAFESTGLPLHRDHQSIIRERIYLDKADRNILYDDITVLDHALTQPWTLHKKIARVNAARPVWRSDLLRGRQRAGAHRQGRLFPERGRLSDADQERPGAARSALFQAIAEMTRAIVAINRANCDSIALRAVAGSYRVAARRVTE
jgi:hypothetical protein